jgi:hypothetical protein
MQGLEKVERQKIEKNEDPALLQKRKVAKPQLI